MVMGHELLPVTVALHCGRVQFRRKTIKESTINISTVFSRKALKRIFSDDTANVQLSCSSFGLKADGPPPGVINDLPYNFFSEEIIPYFFISDIYVSSLDFRDDLDKIAEWPKYFQALSADNFTNEDVDDVQTFFILTKNLKCYLFFSKERRASFQNSLRRLLNEVLTHKNSPPKQGYGISGIKHLPQRNGDVSVYCPFNTEAEWSQEISSCPIDFQTVKPFRGFKFEFEVKPNNSWSNSLSQHYVVPKMFSSTIWLFTHTNGSLLLLAPTSSGLSPNTLHSLPVFELDELLPDQKFLQKTFIDFSRYIASGHFSDWLASSATFWAPNGEFATKWLDNVSKILEVSTQVINAMLSSPLNPVILLASNKSLCLIVGALVQLCLSPDTRGNGFSINRLIQKYFVSLGFPFRLEGNQQNYVFILFLDCFYQLICQNPSSFAVSERYLNILAVSFISDFFYEFSFSSPRSRIDACRRDKGYYRWFFPLQQHFRPAVLSSFVNRCYQPPYNANTPAETVDDAVLIKEPISYYPFKLNNHYNMYTRSHSAGNLCEPDHYSSNTTVCINPVSSAASRMSRVASSLDPRNFFRQRASPQTLIIYKPLVLRKAVVNQNLPPPSEYFVIRPSKKRTGTEAIIIPRFRMPCLRLWSEFFMCNEFDFGTYSAVVP